MEQNMEVDDNETLLGAATGLLVLSLHFSAMNFPPLGPAKVASFQGRFRTTMKHLGLFWGGGGGGGGHGPDN